MSLEYEPALEPLHISIKELSPEPYHHPSELDHIEVLNGANSRLRRFEFDTRQGENGSSHTQDLVHFGGLVVEPIARNPKHQTRNPKLETRDPRPET